MCALTQIVLIDGLNNIPDFLCFLQYSVIQLAIKCKLQLYAFLRTFCWHLFLNNSRLFSTHKRVALKHIASSIGRLCHVAGISVASRDTFGLLLMQFEVPVDNLQFNPDDF